MSDKNEFPSQEEVSSTTGPQGPKAGQGGKGKNRSRSREKKPYPRSPSKSNVPTPVRKSEAPLRPTGQKQKLTVSGAPGAPSAEKSYPQPPAIKDVTALMNARFPCYQTVNSDPVRYPLNSSVYLEICQLTYEQVCLVDSEFPEYISLVEFLLCCSQVLASSMLKFMTVWDANPHPAEPLLSKIADSVHELPTAIALFINNLGSLRCPDGTRVIPMMHLPTPKNKGLKDSGKLPSDWTGPAGENEIEMDAIFHMPPFGFYREYINHQGDMQQVNLLYEEDSDYTASIRSRFHPFKLNYPPVVEDRKQHMRQAAHDNEYLRAIGYDPQLFRDFLLCLERIKTVMTMMPLRPIGAGNMAQLCQADFGSDAAAETTVSYASPYQLSSAEIHLGRIMCYRAYFINPTVYVRSVTSHYDRDMQPDTLRVPALTDRRQFIYMLVKSTKLH